MHRWSRDFRRLDLGPICVRTRRLVGFGAPHASVGNSASKPKSYIEVTDGDKGLLTALCESDGAARCRSGHGSAGRRRSRFAQRHDDDRRQVTAAAAAEVRRRDQHEAPRIQAVVAAAGGAAQRRAQRAADHDRRSGLRRLRHLRRRHSDAGMDRIAKVGLRYTQFHSTALCSPTRAALITGRNHHSVGFGVIAEQSTGYPGLRLRHRPGERHDRHDPEAKTATPRRGSARTTTRRAISTARPGRSTNGPVGMGFEYFYGFMGGETDQWTPYLFQNHDADLPVGRQDRLQPDHRPGRRSDRAHEAAQRGRARQAVLRLLRPRRHALAAPADEGVDREVQGQVRHGLERDARADLRQPEAARRDPGEYATHRPGRTTCRSGTR